MAAIRGTRRLVLAGALVVSSLSAIAHGGHDTQVVFDLPPAIECREVTPPEFAKAHPTMKVVEGTLRISAQFTEGSEARVVDFLYVIDNPTISMRFQDYLPNTMLESAVVDDQIEITDASEKINGAGLDARVVYKPFTVGGTLNHNSKASESSHYRQIAPKELVLASGTTNREHGVFYRLRPSRDASLEGAKEFKFLAAVPATWRGDLCAIECRARAQKSSIFSSSVTPAGSVRALVPLHLAGDAEALDLVHEYRRAQQAYAKALAAHDKDNVFDVITSHAVGLFTFVSCETKSAKKLDEAKQDLADIQQRLRKLAR